MNANYLFKHWFGTIILAPVIAKIYDIIFESDYLMFDLFEAFFAFFFVGLILSAPTYFLYGFLFEFLKRKDINKIFAKLTLITFALTGIVSTFLLIGGSMKFKGIIFYSIASVITGMFFELNFKETNDNN